MSLVDSYVCGVLFAKHPRSYGISTDRWRWRRLMAALYDPYKPHLHYMRGPGRKWKEKHAKRDRIT